MPGMICSPRMPICHKRWSFSLNSAMRCSFSLRWQSIRNNRKEYLLFLACFSPYLSEKWICIKENRDDLVDELGAVPMNGQFGWSSLTTGKSGKTFSLRTRVPEREMASTEPRGEPHCDGLSSLGRSCVRISPIVPIGSLSINVSLRFVSLGVDPSELHRQSGADPEVTRRRRSNVFSGEYARAMGVISLCRFFSAAEMDLCLEDISRWIKHEIASGFFTMAELRCGTSLPLSTEWHGSLLGAVVLPGLCFGSAHGVELGSRGFSCWGCLKSLCLSLGSSILQRWYCDGLYK